MNRKRKIRRYRPVYQGRKMQVNFLPVVVIICLSVCAGYFTAKYIISPFLGYEPASLSFFSEEEKEYASVKPTKEEEAAEESTDSAETPVILEDQAEVKDMETKETAKVSKTAGYALQFGSYSTKAAAEKSLEQLEASGISAEIKEQDGHYKVVGPLFETKEEAKKQLNELDESVAAFVTELEE